MARATGPNISPHKGPCIYRPGCSRCLILTLTMPSDPSPSSLSSLKLHRRELWGWLSYAFASEVFVIVSLTLFLPICLEQFARDNGFLLPDKTIPCSSSPAPPVGTVEEDEVRCVVKLGWVWIDTASFRCVGIHLVCSCPVFAGGSCLRV